MPDQKPIIHWHQLLAELFRLMLSSLDVEVQAEVNVLTKPPRADILLIRRKTAQWTKEQLTFIPSGIRSSTAPQILIEFKKTESLSTDAIVMLTAYHLFYCKSNRVNPTTVLPVLIVSKQPQRSRLAAFGFEPADEAGVYRCTNILAKQILLITLNELETTVYNAFVQFFASQGRVREQALEQLQSVDLETIPEEVYWYAAGVWKQQNPNHGDKTMEATTTEQLIEDGRRFWKELILPTLSLQERLAGLKPEELAQALDEEQLKQLFALLQNKLDRSAESPSE